MSRFDAVLASAPPIDPFAPGQGHRYTDALVDVLQDSTLTDDWCEEVVRTAHFRLRRREQRIEIAHRLQPRQLDNDLAGMLADELFEPGWLAGVEIFERVFTGVVRSVLDDPLLSWNTFYGNTLRRIRECWSRPRDAHLRRHSSIAGFAPVYQRALRLASGRPVLDLGSCFGFLPLLLAEHGGKVIASDVAAGSMRLLRSIAEARDIPLRTLVCDATQVPLPDRSVDTVTALHLLEHMDAARGQAVLSEAVRVARHRVVIAVPFGEDFTDAFGHVRTFTRADLIELGQATGCEFDVAEYHGGWLVIHTGPG